ncbi:MAG: cellulose biosynthesis cyclic di-GMP-binding regulatory protein BcsB [Desulfotomaculaceae bacterium]|nr:cellulose biosynthesis cyclic di-GMP-binding regulatory protein BcsB [Desulfotomaculaceae bacterium]
MKKTRFLWIAPVLAVMMVLAAFLAGANAATKATGENVEVPLFTEPQSLKLPHNTTFFWFMLPNGTKLGDKCSLSLRMSVTGTLINDYSSVTLLINNVQISSIHIMDIIHNNVGCWTVPIPAERLKTDGTLNELKVVTTQRSILGDCADIDNPSNWVTLEESSCLDLDVLRMSDPDLSTALPYFFNRVDQTNRTNAEFILPSGADYNTRAAMLTIASAIGAEYPAKDNVRFTVSQGSSASEEQNRIYIGLGSQQPKSTTTIPALAAGNGYLAVARNGSRNDFCISGADAAGLAKAAAFFTNAKYLAQLSGSSAVVSTDLRNKAEEFTKKEDGYYSLSDFGYDTASLAGAFHQEVTYVLKQPEGIRSGSGSYVEIHFRHSTALVADTSLLTVYVNNVAINSIQMSDSNAAGDTIKAKIPASALEKSTINIKVECYNYLGKVDCSKDYYDTAWTVVDKDSVVYFEPGNSSLRPTVQQFPVFDTHTAKSAHSAILSLPQNASESLLEAAAELACRAGQNSGAACRWEYTNTLSASSNKASSDILIMGSNDSVAIPDEVAKLLDVVPHENNNFTIADTASVTAEALQNKIVVQAVRSPWNFSRKVYIVTCPSSMESQLKQFVTDRSSLNKLSGSMALIDEKGTVTTISGTSAEMTDKIPLTADRAISQIVRVTGIPRVGLLIILVCILIIILLLIKVLANRRRFANAKKKMEIINANAGKYDSKVPSPAAQSLPKDKGKETAEPADFDHDIDDR